MYSDRWFHMAARMGEKGEQAGWSLRSNQFEYEQTIYSHLNQYPFWRGRETKLLLCSSDRILENKGKANRIEIRKKKWAAEKITRAHIVESFIIRLAVQSAIPASRPYWRMRSVCHTSGTTVVCLLWNIQKDSLKRKKRASPPPLDVEKSIILK